MSAELDLANLREMASAAIAGERNECGWSGEAAIIVLDRLEAAERERDEARAALTRYGDEGALQALREANDRADAADAVIAAVRPIATTGTCAHRYHGDECGLYREEHVMPNPPHQFKRPPWELALTAALNGTEEQ